MDSRFRGNDGWGRNDGWGSFSGYDGGAAGSRIVAYGPGGVVNAVAEEGRKG